MATSETAAASLVNHLMVQGASGGGGVGVGGGGFDSKKALKNCANMAMSAGLYWPTGFADSSAYAAAYSQASALAAAASNMQNLAGNGGSMHAGYATSHSAANALVSGQLPLGFSTVLDAGCKSGGGGVGVGGVVCSGGGGGGSGGSSAPSSNGSAGSAPPMVHSTTPLTPKKRAQPVPDHMKDELYWDRRKRNNESARRSRESRRQKEETIAYRANVLECENVQLRTELTMLRAEVEKMRMILYQSSHHH